MIRYCLLFSIPLWTFNSCVLTKSIEPEIVTSSNSEQQSASSESQVSPSSQDDSCLNNQRLLNPDAEPQPSETELDRYFRLAFNAETEGNFDEAITDYQKAAEIATCECDKQHALAGKQAAEEAKNLFVKYGIASKPTQFFWNRLQELTESLPCVHVTEQ